MVCIDTLRILAGSANAKVFSLAVAWAVDHRETPLDRWSALDGCDGATFVIGAPLPRLRPVVARDRLRVAVAWEIDGPRAVEQVVDLAPAVFRHRIDAPLRDDARLFSTVRVTDDGFAVA